MNSVVVAPDSFKGTLGAAGAAAALARGWQRVRPDDTVVQRPMADGGEGTLAAFERAVPGSRRIPVTVTGPDGRPVEAAWLLLGDAPGHGAAAVVELASTSGIELVNELRPMQAHTRGFGEAVAAALDAGVDRLILGIGSSASTEGGTGMLSALGAVFLDADQRPVEPGAAGLARLTAVDLSGLRRPPPGGVEVLTDVTNPLLGPNGAAQVFGPQKGATVEQVRRLDAGLARLASLMPATDPRTAGAGAAGGCGFALLAWGGRLRVGASAVADLIGLPAAIAAASVVVTGEGSFDGSSAGGKVPTLVAALAADAGVPAMLAAGRVDGDPADFACSVSLTGLAGSTEAAMADPVRWLEDAGGALAERWSVSAGPGARQHLRS